MEAFEAITTRRSIRKFTDQAIDDQTIAKLLEAAMSAPTAAGEVWRYIIVRERSDMEAVGQFHPHVNMLNSANAAIVVCADPTLENLKDRWIMDCSAATENILIAANALKLGACWVGIYPVQERIEGLRTIFGIPDQVVPLCMVALGYPDEKKNPPNRFKKEFVFFGKWGSQK